MVVISMLCNTYTEVPLLIQKNSHNMLTPSFFILPCIYLNKNAIMKENIVSFATIFPSEDYTILYFLT